MKGSTFLRILLGGALILACAAAPFYRRGPGNSAEIRSTVFVLSSAGEGPYTTVDPGAIWLHERAHGSLLRYEAGKLVPGRADAWGEDGSPRLESRLVFRVLPGRRFLDGPATPLRICRALALLRPPISAKPVGEDRFEVRTHTGPPERLVERVRAVGPKAIAALPVESEIVLVLRAVRTGGDPGLYPALLRTRAGIRARGREGRFAALGPAGLSEGSSRREIRLTGRRFSFDLVSACLAPLAGEGARDWLNRRGFLVRRTGQIKEDIVASIRKGKAAAAFTVDPPEDLPSADLGVRVYLAAVFNRRGDSTRTSADRKRLIEIWRGKKGALPPRPLRIVVRRSDPAARARALRLAECWSRAGALASVEPLLEGDFRARVRRGSFEVMIDLFPTAFYMEPEWWWKSSAPRNWSGYGAADLDRMLSELNRTFDPRNRARLREGIHAWIRERALWIDLLPGATLKIVGTKEALDRLGLAWRGGKTKDKR